MTRPYNHKAECPNCRSVITWESSFSRWIRDNKQLDSKDGYCVVDQDYWIHAFKTSGSRDFQCIMLVEIKTMGAILSDAQKDTLHMVNQITRNRKETPTKKNVYQAGTSTLKVYSAMRGKRVYLRSFGMHVLTFSSLGPDDSEWMKWDKRIIDRETLTNILQFNLDPDDISKPFDMRSHHGKRINRQETLPMPGLVAA
jgi:hypothetical protein